MECWIGKAAGAFARLKVCVWKWCNIRLTTKMKIFDAVIITTLLYASECWTLLATDLAKLEVFQMSCLRRILGVMRHDRLRNDTILHHCTRNSPQLGCGYNGIACDGSAMCVAWTTPICQNTYGQSARMGGIAFPTHLGISERIRLLPTSRCMSLGASTVNFSQWQRPLA